MSFLSNPRSPISNFIRLLILLILLLGYSPSKAEPASPFVTVAFLDVGQGDATLIRYGNNFDILVDGGNKGASESIIAYLKDVNVDDLEIVIATHADRDHIGGLIGLIEGGEIPVESVFYNGYPGTTQTWIEFSDAVTASGLVLNETNYPDTFSWGGVEVHVLNPVTGLIDPDQNKASVVLRFDYANSSLILPGDIDSNIEVQLLNRAVNLDADVLKIAHHGSNSSTSEIFLAAVMPQEAIISVGLNSYGHPGIETIYRLEANDIGIWRTDILGTVYLSTDGETIKLLPKLLTLPFVMNSLQ